MNLDFMPSPSPERPGLFIRDPYRYSDAMLIIPPVLVECLRCFDGSQTDLDLRAALVRITNNLDVGEIERHLVETLSQAGFLEDDNFARIETERRQEFAVSAVREPAHAGAAYPAELDGLRQTMVRYMDGAGARAADPNLFAIAAPHVSPEGGWQSYQAAYSVLRPEHRERTFVILATSHYGEPEKFGLTRKGFQTPLGEAQSDRRLVDWLAERGGAAVEMEDFCHSFEHTVELQVVFLAHMGARYHDRFSARAGQGAMAEVQARDEARIARINGSDADGFWDLVQEKRDDLKWCGSSPFYTFLKAAPKARGELLRYEQWNIDDRSVVS